MLNDLFATPGMITMTLVVLAVQVASVAIMLLLIYEYRHIHQKRLDLVRGIHGSHVTHAIWERRLLITVYSVFTIGIVLASSFFFLFQSHLL